MYTFSGNNLYLCDLEYLGAEISFADEVLVFGKRHVKAKMQNGKTYTLTVMPSPQGYQVVEVKGMMMLDFVHIVLMASGIYHDTSTPYMRFARTRRFKVNTLKFAQCELVLLSCLWMSYYYGRHQNSYLILIGISLACAVGMTFLKRNELRKTYQDYLISHGIK